MTKHPKNVKGFEGSLEKLAKSIGNMAYDEVANFIGELADDLKRQADSDLAKGRRKLAYELYVAADELYDAKKRMESAWEICKPYMTK